MMAEATLNTAVNGSGNTSVGKKSQAIWYGLAAFGICLAAAPLAAGGYYITLATEIVIAAVFALGLNLLIGYTGMVSLGHAMFFGLGGYGIGIGCTLLKAPLWVSVIVTLVAVALVSAIIGAICTRTKGVQFLLITLAFSQMMYGAAIKLPWTNRSDGMSGIPRPDLGWFGVDSASPVGFYCYTMVVFGLCLLLFWRIVTSPVGTVLVGIRENERRTVSMGYAVGWYKVGAFIMSALLASVAGILQAQYTYFISPDSMTWQMSGEGVLLVIIGGVGTILGPLVGAGVFVLVKQALSMITEEYLLFFGIFFMIVVGFFRGGVVGAFENLLKGRAK
ncbi:branched-chain amino acid ABC transporter permease [Variovorax sp. Root411]|uniref:branched-chain amino acid ABC transporter permease n=1 Tax=Variovorax sp. Root411 TaxID=1736530 RepID=UPI0006FA0446|nr:branched-chain amino acid ABC transporter permease [Variovorax sp. Root411]KQW61774.1 branched-chain amino acid ABC transporter permease [Variovorax sp. Root411]